MLTTMSKSNNALIFLLVCLALMGLAVSGCGSANTTEHSREVDERNSILKGVSLSPRSYQSADFTDFFEKATQAGQIVMWAGDWSELGNVNEGGPVVIAELASVYDYTPLIEVTFFTQSTGEMIRPLDEAAKHDYLSSAADFADRYKPEYLGFGIEINTLYEKSPEDFAESISLCNDVYDAVKASSPETKVFTVFQLERMKGLEFWGIEPHDAAKAQWWMIDEFKSDIAAFTTYPGLVYTDPSAIPEDHYTEISNHTTKPIAFTEIGWHSQAYPPGWESSESEQAEFVDTFFALTNGLNVELAIWSFLYDPDIIKPFDSMGLYYRTSGVAKQAWYQWLNAS
jgi:outer membrane lipoprotein-sorting protein